MSGLEFFSPFTLNVFGKEYLLVICKDGELNYYYWIKKLVLLVLSYLHQKMFASEASYKVFGSRTKLSKQYGVISLKIYW